MQPIVVIEEIDRDTFESKCKHMVDDGYQISSTSIGNFNLNSALNHYTLYQAILLYIKYEPPINDDINKETDLIEENRNLKSIIKAIHTRIQFTRVQDPTCKMKDIEIEQNNLLKEIFDITNID